MAYNILIIDDSSIVRKVLIKTFGMTDISVANFLQASNGREGLDLLENNQVDLIFLDINMPVMNEMEFMQVFSQYPKFKDKPVIVVSTEGSSQRIEELSRLGVRAYLRKPVSPEILVNTIKEVLEQEK